MQSLAGVTAIQQIDKMFEDFITQLHGQVFLFGQIALPGEIFEPVQLLGPMNLELLLQLQSQELAFVDDIAPLQLPGSPYPHNGQNTGDSDCNTSSMTGLVVRVFGPGGSMALAMVAGKNFKPNRIESALLHMVVTHVHDRLTSLTGLLEQSMPSKLSKRQKECLNWLQYGKNSEDISDILGISAHTVREHINAAKKILGVSTRTEAVIAARKANLLNL